MMSPRDDWINLQNVFNPEQVLLGAQGDRFYCEREHDPLPYMLEDFQPDLQPARPPIGYLAGHRGSGKTSMLLRFARELKDHYFIVYFDIAHNLDNARATQVDLLYLIGATLFHTAHREGLKPDPVNLAELMGALDSITKVSQKKVSDQKLDAVGLTSRLICFGASMFGAETLARSLTDAALKPFTFSSGMTEEVARRRDIEPQVQNLIGNVNLIIADIQTKASKPVLVVVDGLDKLPRYDQARMIFLESRALRGPVCRIVYTVPMFIYNSRIFGKVEDDCKSYVLPNIKLYQRYTGTEYERFEQHGPGYSTLNEVVAKRIQALDIPENPFDSDALDLLILKSGGIMRWLIALVRRACLEAKLMGDARISLQAAQRAVDERRAQLAGRLDRTSVDELRIVRREKRPSDSQAASELLDGHFIVAYRNQTTWFDAHPLIWEEL